MKFIFFISVVSLFFSFRSHAKKFVLHDPLERDIIQFRVSAPLEDVIGTSSKAIGWFELNTNQLSQTKGGEVSIPTSSFATGIKMRDQHMFHSYLEAEKFPDVVFKLESLEGSTLSLEKTTTPVKIKFHGTLQFHGVKRKLVVPATLSYFKENAQTRSKLQGNLVHIKAQFSFLLSDYLIKPPQIVSMQVGDEVEVVASFTLTDKPSKVQPSEMGSNTTPPER